MISTDFPKAYRSLNLRAQFRTAPEDFVVYEHLGFELAGEGEHLLLHIEKTGQNTHWVITGIARQLGINERDVGYCGRKDRHAITRQWLSFYDAKGELDLNGVAIEGVRFLAQTRHNRKLRPGDHAANDFSIRLRDCASSDTGQLLNSEQLQQLLPDIQQRLEQGVPNYFGGQRFGREGSNLEAAQEWFEKGRQPSRKRKSMVLSAARSYLHNLVLAKRVEQGCWSQLIEGDLDEGGYPTVALWGRGRLPTREVALDLEQSAVAHLPDWCRGLEYSGLQQERRVSVLVPQQPGVSQQDNDLLLTFRLPTGAFATAVLAEVATELVV